MSIVDVIKKLVESGPFASDVEKAEHLAAVEAARALESLESRVDALEKRLSAFSTPAAPAQEGV